MADRPDQDSFEVDVENVTGDSINLDVSLQLYDGLDEIAEILVSQNFCKSWWVTPPPSWGRISHILNNLFAGHLSCSVIYQ